MKSRETYEIIRRSHQMNENDNKFVVCTTRRYFKKEEPLSKYT